MEVKYCEDTRPGQQLDSIPRRPLANNTRLLRLKAKKVTLHTILLGVGGSIYASNTLHHLKELGIDSQRILKTAIKLHALSVRPLCSQTNSIQDAHLRKQKALKTLVWSRGMPATLQIHTGYLLHW